MKKSEQKAFLAELKEQRLFQRKYQMVLDSPHTGADGREWARRMVDQANASIDAMLAWAARESDGR